MATIANAPPVIEAGEGILQHVTIIPESLAAACRRVPERAQWLARLPDSIRELEGRWSLTLAHPFDSGESEACAWVAPATRPDGSALVLKLGLPHLEGARELEGLRFWNGDPTVRLLEADAELNAMLLERCLPGTSLRGRPELEQDRVVAGLLLRLWRTPPESGPFRPLNEMVRYWSDETRAASSSWPDPGLVRAGLDLFQQLSPAAPDDVLLATDLHAGNILRAEREPWLVIDPKPFIGDRAYDATQHLLNCRDRLNAAPEPTIRGFADLLEVDHARVRLWLFARLAAEPRRRWTEADLRLARLLE